MMHQKVQIALINTPLKSLFILQVNEKRGGFWQNITGSVEAEDQDLYCAAQREVLEESGIIPTRLEQLPLEFTFKDQWERDVHEFCFVAMTDQHTIELSPEHQQFSLLPFSEVQNSTFKFTSNFECFQKAREWFNNV